MKSSQQQPAKIIGLCLRARGGRCSGVARWWRGEVGWQVSQNVLLGVADMRAGGLAGRRASGMCGVDESQKSVSQVKYNNVL